MKRTRAGGIISILAAGLALLPACRSASRIILADGLRAGTDVVRARMTFQAPGRTWNFKFGEYAIVKSRMSAAATTTTGDGTLEGSLTTSSFWFVLKGAGPETVRVEASQRTGSLNVEDVEIAPGSSVGVEGVTGVHSHLVATLAFEGEEAPPWKLYLNSVKTGGGIGEKTSVSYMTDGMREIVLTPVTNDVPGAKGHSIPARGYEFAEKGTPLGAVQYYGGGIFGLNQNYVHLRRDLDRRTKLLLAAAMTAVMQAKSGTGD